MNHLRAFISGIAFPSVILPIFLCLAVSFQKEELLNIIFIHVIPLIWGLWNVFYFVLLREIFPGKESTKLLLTGATLGVVIAIIGIFWAGIPSIIGLTGNARYLPLFGVPIVYAILWRFIVKPLNDIVGIKKGLVEK